MNIMRIIATIALLIVASMWFAGCATSDGNSQGNGPKVSGYISTGAAISR